MSVHAAAQKRAPATIALALATIVVALVPAAQHALVLDRDAVGAGELWRVATGSLVHFSTSHLVLDLLATCIAGALLERRGWPLAPILFVSATAIGAAVLALAPELGRYGGLSGVVFTLVVLYALDCLTAPASLRTVATIALALLVVKLAWELWSGRFVFVSDAGGAIQPVPIAHVVGALVGVAAYSVARVRGTLPLVLRASARG